MINLTACFYLLQHKYDKCHQIGMSSSKDCLLIGYPIKIEAQDFELQLLVQLLSTQKAQRGPIF